MMESFTEKLKQRYDQWKNTTTFSGATVEDIEQHYEHTGERGQKDAALYGLQLAVDAHVEGEIDEEEFEDVLDSAVSHVENYYFDAGHEEELALPDTEKETKAFLLQDNHDIHEHFHRDMQEYDGDPDTVVAVASGGLEPGIIAAEEFDAELQIIRYSKWRVGDDDVHDLGDTQDYEGRDLLVVEDKDGDTMDRVVDYLETKDPASIDTTSIV
ncbi:MAG: phosphoribosyltransferase family protein [Candidatus Nanohaloarchaea archaeon]